MKRTTFLASIIITSAAAVAALAATAEVRARTWSPLVRLAAGKGPDAPRLAAERMKDGAAAFGALLNGLDGDEATREFFTAILEKLETFDLASLYDALPEEEPNGVRAVGFTGHASGGRYLVQKVPAVEAAGLDPEKGQGSRFLDLGLAFRSRKAATGGNFVGDVRIGAGLGNASWLQMVACFAEEFRLIESTGPGAPPREARQRPEKATLLEVKQDNPKLGPEDLELMGLFRESFPQLYEHLRELYRTDDILVYDPDGDSYQQIHFVIAFRQDTAKHRAVIEWLSRLGPLMNGRCDFCDAKGRALVTLRFSTKDLAMTLDAFVSGGKLCPVEGGKVLVDEGVDVETIAATERKDRWSFETDVNGIITEVKDLVMKVKYASDETGLHARIVMDEEPKVRVHGSAFGVIPTWAIDVVVPGNMEELTSSFFRAVAKGNDGKGLVVDAGTRVGKNGVHLLDIDAQAEGLNNFLVRLAFKTPPEAIPPDDVVDDLGAYFKAGQKAFTADLQAFAADLK